jgi:xanthine dehydrogenase accessory factor
VSPTNLYREMATLTEDGTPFVLVTVVESAGSTPRKAGAKMIVLPDGRTIDTIGGGKVEAQATVDALDCLQRGISRVAEYELRATGEHALGMVCGGETKVFLEVHVPAKTLVLVGAGHISQKLAPMAKMLDMRVVVVDSREELANESVFPDADEVVVGDQGDVGTLIPMTERSNVVIVTHGHIFDKEALRSVVSSRAGYIGMIGSRSKVRTVLSQLEEEGVDPEALSRVYTPIGLDIGGQTPAEIAISILAEIIAVEHGKIDAGRNLTNLRKAHGGE